MAVQIIRRGQYLRECGLCPTLKIERDLLARWEKYPDEGFPRGVLPRFQRTVELRVMDLSGFGRHSAQPRWTIRRAMLAGNISAVLTETLKLVAYSVLERIVANTN